MRKRIAIVTPRFSDKLVEGAEILALNFAKILSNQFEVTVLTTTALDYITWRNEFLPGNYEWGGIQLKRFSVDRKRNIYWFNYLSKNIYKNHRKLSDFELENWIMEQGPVSSQLIEYIQKNIEFYDLFFINYLYYTTVYGLPLVKNKSICLPTLHEEIPAYFQIYKKLFTDDIIYCFNTLEELNLFQKIYGFIPSKFSIIGMSIKSKFFLPSTTLGESFMTKMSPYVIYVGRLDAGKKVYELIDYFIEWKDKTVNDIRLFIVGENPKNYNVSKSIVFTGYLSESLKYSYIKNSMFLINSSPLESFSIVIMEAWSLEKAVLVNGDSIVLKKHCQRSHGGLYYSCKNSFWATMDFLVNNPVYREKMGKNGKKYVELNYSEDVVQNKLFALVTI